MISNHTMSVPKNIHEVKRSLISSRITSCTSLEKEDAIPIYARIQTSEYTKQIKLLPTLTTKLSKKLLENKWRSTNDRTDFFIR